MGAFSDKVFAVVRLVPRGKVATYGQVARMIGSPRSARYVGYALRANPDPGTEPGCTPCHRVVLQRRWAVQGVRIRRGPTSSAPCWKKKA